MEAKFEFGRHCEFLQQDMIQDWAADAKQTSTTNDQFPFLALSLFQGFSLDYRSISNRKTQPASEMTVCSQFGIYERYQGMPDKWEIEKIKVKDVEAVRGPGRGLGKTAAVQIGYSQLGVCLAAVP